MKILVTGNLGYIGPVLTRELVSRGHDVHGYDSGLFARCAIGQLPPLASQTIADMRDTPRLRRAISSCEAVIHLAAMSNDPLSVLDPSVARSVNLDATLELMDASRDRALVFYSSATVYGPTDTPCREDAAVHPPTLYSEMKVVAERAALASPNALVQRNGTVHGPAPIIRGDLLLNAMVASAVMTNSVVPPTAPETMRPVIDVRDLAFVTAELLERKATGLYNVASQNISVGEAARLVAERTGAELVERDNPARGRNYCIATDKVNATAPGWRPRSLTASIDGLLSHYRNMRSGEFPYMAMSYRSTAGEHVTHDGPPPVGFQPLAFVEVPEELAAEKGIKNGDRVRLSSMRGKLDVAALVTNGPGSVLVAANKKTYTIGIPIHWGSAGGVVERNPQRSETHSGSDVNAKTPEVKAFLVNIEKL